MGIPGSANFLLAGGGAPAYEIEQSLRFDGSSYLYRTNSGTGSRDIYTFSFWVKRAALGGNHTIWSVDGEANSQQTSGHDIRFVNGSSYATNDELIFSSYIRPLRATTGVQRDPSAWAHYVIAVDTTQATQNDRIKMWVNGDSTITDAINTGYWPGQNQDTTPNRSGDPVEIGRNTRSSSEYGNFYLAEFHYVDGTAYDETSFGEYDDNGVWRPIEVSGLSYGTNGWYMKFDPSATNGIGHDHSGNGNNFTASGFTTSGTGTDVMFDTPTTNYPTWNALERGDDPASSMGVDLSEGNLVAAMNRDVGDGAWVANFTVPKSGKWYWEVEQLTAGSPNPFISTGIIAYPWTWNSSDYVSYQSRGRITKDWNGVTYQSVTAWGAGYGNASDVCGVAVDADNNTVQYYVNGTAIGNTESYSGNSYTYVPFTSTAANTAQNVRYNFGQRAFAYTPPTGFNALNTANLPAPDIADGSDYFQTITYSGTSAARSLTVADNSGNGWQPDLVWIKSRNDNYYHRTIDAVRGATKEIYPNDTGVEATVATSLTSFNSDGFSLGSSGAVNETNKTFVAWNWKAGGSGSSNTSGSITSTVSANPSAGFSIVAWAGTGTAGTVGHGLGVAPGMIIVKNRTLSRFWPVYHYYMHQTSAPETLTCELDRDVSRATVDFWNNTAPTSTVFSVKTSDKVNALNSNYIAYCFAEVENYSRIGKYTGNGSSDGPFVYCGFRPAYILFKRTDAVGSWFVRDAERDPYNGTIREFYLDANGNEYTVPDIDFLSNGFKIRVPGNYLDRNATNGHYIFAAFAENPFGGEGVSPATAR